MTASVAPISVAAQSKEKPYALIFVNVYDHAGHVLYGVPVRVRRADQKKALMDGISDHSGEVAFRVPPGPADYIVWADIKAAKKDKKAKSNPPSPAPGAVPAASAAPQSGGEVRELKVHIAGEERVDISLHLTE